MHHRTKTKKKMEILSNVIGQRFSMEWREYRLIDILGKDAMQYKQWENLKINGNGICSWAIFLIQSKTFWNEEKGWGNVLMPYINQSGKELNLSKIYGH